MKKIEVVIEDADLEKVVQAVCRAVRIPASEDGRILVYDIEDAIPLSSGEGIEYSEATFDVEEFLRSQRH